MANKDGRPILTELNNGILKSTNAMPLKDLTSDNDASFELSRKIFNKAYIPKTNYQTAAVGRSFFQRRAPGIEHGYIVDGPKSVQQKKWMGGNRDASHVAERRRKATTGAIMSYSGQKSFVTVNDNNPRIDALARVRGGGACVPPKVSNRPVKYATGPTIVPYYRIIAAGMNAVTNFVVNYTGSTAYNISPGIYSYTNISSVQKPLYNVTPLATFGRSYNVFTIDKASGATTFKLFDVFLLPGVDNQALMTTYLNSLPNTVFVIIATYDEPSTVNGVSSTLTTNFINAVKNCGASNQFASGTFYYRSAYVLVGTPGIGTGKGLEKYVGINNGVTGDSQAVIDLKIYFANGNVTYVSG